MTLHLYNSLSRKKEEFIPLVAGEVGIYVCGPTVYSHSHLGHAKSYVSFDVIIKWLRKLGYRVRYVQNITDVGHMTDNDEDQGEDKIEKKARYEKIHPLEVVDTFMFSYFADMDALGVARPNMWVRATQHVPEQIELTQKLIEKGHAYVSGGNVYFDVSSWPEYGCLSGRTTEETQDGHRVAVRSDKRNPQDFALWKTAVGTPHVMRWPSPWGEGFPGWHIECSAMAMKYLGETFDIHGGGNENKFPHHECEIAQSRAGTGGGFARYWLHNNMINIDGQKMSKSLGNSVLIQDALKSFSSAAIRLFLLSTHYGSPSNYTQDGMSGAAAGTERLGGAREAIARALKSAPKDGPGDHALLESAAKTDEAIKAAMNDDFNSPVAIAALFNHVKVVNTKISEGAGAGALAAAAAVIDTYGDELFGILPKKSASAANDAQLTEGLMKAVLDVRAAMREQKLWGLADLLRDRLAPIGIVIKDTKDGATWTRS